MNEIIIKPVGIVISEIEKPEEMPPGGTPAVIEIYPEYREALQGIEENSMFGFWPGSIRLLGIY
jgi:tRNA (Thr-GGU) A37 N-methylase